MCVCAACACIQQDRIQVNNGALTINSLILADIGMYQCVAENKHGRIFTNAELRVIGRFTRARLCTFVNIIAIEVLDETLKTHIWHGGWCAHL